jgi:hypothetical protein
MTQATKQHLGMWSSGTRLADSARIVPAGLVDDDLPEYMVMVFFIHDLDTLTISSPVWRRAKARSTCGT